MNKELKAKIKDILDISDTELKEGAIPYYQKMNAKINLIDDLLSDLKTMAKNNSTILGRSIKFPMADGYALYVITKVNKTTVQLTWLDYCDAWIDTRIGKKGNINIEYAKQQLGIEDKLHALFAS